VGYTGAGLFPGRCFGLAVGIVEFQTSHWVRLLACDFGVEMLTPSCGLQVWWAPDILAAILHGFLHKTIPPYIKPYPGPLGARAV